MSVSDKFKEHFNKQIVNYTFKVYIEDSGVRSGTSYTREPEYVDFSDRCEETGRNLLTKIASIQHITEGEAATGISYSKTSSINFDNSDGFFNEPFPSTLQTINGNTANFPDTKRNKLSNLYHHKIRIKVSVLFDDNSIEEGLLGTFIITGSKKSTKNKIFTLNLSDLSQPLRQKNSAENVKDGLGWYEDKGIKFLVERLLENIYYQKTGDEIQIPTTFNISDNIEIPTKGTTQGDSGDVRDLSIIGRPPRKDGTTGAYVEGREAITRAMVYVPMSSNNLTPGVYIGLDDSSGCEVWRYEESEQASYHIDSASDLNGNEWYIWRMWYDSTLDIIVFVAVNKNDLKSTETRGTQARFYKIDSGDNIIRLDDGTIDNMFMGDYCYREGFEEVLIDKKIGFLGIDAAKCIGNNSPSVRDFATFGENISIPFQQKLKFTAYPSSKTTKDYELKKFARYWYQTPENIQIDRGYFGEAAIQSQDGELPGEVYASVIVEHDWHIGASDCTAQPAGVRFTFGQSGFCVYNEEHHKIIFSTVEEIDFDEFANIGQQNAYDKVEIKVNSFDVQARIKDILIEKQDWEISVPVYDSDTNNYTGVDFRYRIDPLCGCSGQSNSYQDYIFIGAMCWVDTDVAWSFNDFDRSRGLLYRLDLRDNTLLKIYDSQKDSSTENKKGFSPVWMAYNNVSGNHNQITVVSYDRHRVDSQIRYRMLQHQPYSKHSFTELEGYYAFSTIPMALTFDSNHILYFISDGQLYNYQAYTSNPSYTINFVNQFDSGREAVNNENYSSVHALAIDEDTRGTGDDAIIYGISSPKPPQYDLLKSSMRGKYYLWKYDSQLSSNVELADFTGMSRWDAIEAFAMVSDCFAGFDLNGNFIFTPRANLETSTSFTVENTAENRKKISLDIETGEDEVYNTVTVTPYNPILKEPEVSITLSNKDKEKADEREVRKGTLVVSQKGTDKMKVYMECLTDGKVSEKPIRFKYKILGNEFTTSLKNTTTAGYDYLYLNSGVQDIKKGDVLLITSNINNVKTEETAIVNSDPTKTELKTGKVNLQSSLVYSHPFNSHIKVSKSYEQWSNSNKNNIIDPYFEYWGEDEDSLIYYTKSHAGISVKKFVDQKNIFWNMFYEKPEVTHLFGNSSAFVSILMGASGMPDVKGIYQKIDKKRFKPNTYYTIFGWFWSPSKTTLIKEVDCGFQIKDSRGQILNSNFEDVVGVNFKLIKCIFKTNGNSETDTYSPDDILIYIAMNSDSSDYSPYEFSFFAVDGLNLFEGLIHNPEFFLLGQANYHYLIGNSNIELMFQNVEGSPEFVWKTGDRIIIDCPGMTLEEEPALAVTAIDPVSRDEYGEKTYPSFNNKFITSSIADIISTRLLEDYKWPHYKIKATIPFTPYLNFISPTNLLYRVDVVDKEMFKESGENTETGKVQGITHGANNQTTIKLRSLNPI